MFFKHIIPIPDLKERFLRDQLGLLKHVVRLYLLRFPFQNITSFGQYRPVDRWAPGLKEMLKANYSGGGGLCGHNNVFLKHQLESIGYQCHQVLGCFVRTGIPHSHCVFTVKIPARACKLQGPPRDLSYIVDVGTGIPLEEPICIEDLPYRGRGGGCDYRFEWRDPMTVQRVNEGGDAIIGPKEKGFMSPQNYTITMRPVSFAEYAGANGPVSAVYTNPRSVFLHQGIYAFRYLEIQDKEGGNFKAVAVVGKDVIHITRETRSVERHSSLEDVEPVLHEYFPMIDKDQVRKAIEHFSIPLEEAIKLPSVRVF